MCRGDWSGTAIRNAVFEEAGSDLVLCVDSPVLVVPRAHSRLFQYLETQGDSRDLVQEPLLYDDLHKSATHFEPRWNAGMYGVWAMDPRGADSEASAFEISMQGLGLFACRRKAWPGFSRIFREFGGEEGSSTKNSDDAAAGRSAYLLDGFIDLLVQWVCLTRTGGNTAYAITELGLETDIMEAHFAEPLGTDNSSRIFASLWSEVQRKFSFADGLCTDRVGSTLSGRSVGNSLHI
jgi:hypothetical protein